MFPPFQADKSGCKRWNAAIRAPREGQDIGDRPGMLGRRHRVDHKVECLKRRAARFIVATQVMARSVEVQVGCGKVAFHSLLLIARHGATIAESLYREAKIGGGI